MSIATRKARLKKKNLFQKTRKWFIILLCLFLAGYLLLSIGGYLYELCLYYQAQTVVAKKGNLAASFSCEGIILRKEILARASLPGTAVFHVSEGTRVAVETDVATIKVPPDLTGKTDNLTLKAPRAGIVYLSWDGLEETLNPEDWQNLNLEDLFSEKYRQEMKTIGKTVQIGCPVYKIVDYLVNPKVVMRIKNEDLCLVEEQEVILEWGQDHKGSGRVNKAWVNAGYCYLVVEIQEKAANLPHERFLNLQLIPDRYEGIVIPSSAIVKKEKAKGIFIASVNGYCFQEINVVGKVGDKVIIDGILPGEEILVGPQLLLRSLVNKFAA